MNLREKTLPDLINKESLHISVSQSISKEDGGNKKPHF